MIALLIGIIILMFCGWVIIDILLEAHDDMNCDSFGVCEYGSFDDNHVDSLYIL